MLPVTQQTMRCSTVIRMGALSSCSVIDRSSGSIFVSSLRFVFRARLGGASISQPPCCNLAGCVVHAPQIKPTFFFGGGPSFLSFFWVWPWVCLSLSGS